MPNLKRLCEEVLCRWLCSLYGSPERANPPPCQVWHYLFPAAPLLMNVVNLSRYYNCPHLTKIFLPLLVCQGKIHITSNNVEEFVEYCKTEANNDVDLMKSCGTRCKYCVLKRSLVRSSDVLNQQENKRDDSDDMSNERCENDEVREKEHCNVNKNSSNSCESCGIEGEICGTCEIEDRKSCQVRNSEIKRNYDTEHRENSDTRNKNHDRDKENHKTVCNNQTNTFSVNDATVISNKNTSSSCSVIHLKANTDISIAQRLNPTKGSQGGTDACSKVPSVIYSLTQVKVDVEGFECLSLLPVLGQLRNLRVLVFISFVTDDILSILGINCKELQIFDCQEDAGVLVSDVGLAYLSQCRKLKKVYFSVDGDEYDHKHDKLGFTGKGLALILMLPEIEHVLCSKYLLRDAIHFLYQSRCQNITLNLKVMLLDHMEVRSQTLQIMPNLFPELEVVSAWVEVGKEKILGRSLISLQHLKTLVITLESGASIRDLCLSSYGNQLSFLSLTIYTLDCEDIILLSQVCTQLRTLVLKMHSFGFDGAVELKQPLFPTLKRLELQYTVSVRLFKYLNSNIRGLKELHCGYATIHNFQEAVKYVLMHDGWQNIEHLSLPTDQGLPLEIAKLLVLNLKSLRHLVAEVKVIHEAELTQYIKLNAPDLKWSIIPETSPSTSGCFSQSVWI